MSDHALSPATAGRLRSLRVRVTLLITLLAAVVVGVFAAIVIRLDRDLRDEQLDAELLRRTDEVSRQITFEDVLLDDVDVGLLGDDVVVAAQQEFDIFALVDEQDLWSEIPDPSPEDLREFIAEVFFDVSPIEQDDLLDTFVPDPDDELDRDERIELMLSEPPEQLRDAAERMFTVDQVIESDIELDIPTDIVRGIGSPLSDPQVFEVVGSVLDGDDEELLFDVEATTVRARGVPLTDGAETRGAVIAVVDPALADAAHADLRTRVVAVAIALVGFAAGAAWLVAGRTTRPVALALAQQERFLADAAHELRTPVAAIRATAEAPTTDASEAAGRLQRVTRLAEGASALTDDLLTLARMDAQRLELQTEPTRLDLLLEAIVDGAPNVVLSVDAEVIADVDPGLIERAVSNLVRNAEHHGLATPHRPAVVTLSGGRIEITDEGPGLPPRVDVFDRFASGSSSRGHGLGLPLARWIARAHGGDLTAGSGPGDRGARFVFTIPTDRLRAATAHG